jgi:hypothetical protein
MARCSTSRVICDKACLSPGLSPDTPKLAPAKARRLENMWEKSMMLTVSVSHPSKTAKGWGSLSWVAQTMKRRKSGPARLLLSSCRDDIANRGTLFATWGEVGKCVVHDQCLIGQKSHCVNVENRGCWIIPTTANCTIAYCPGKYRFINSGCMSFADDFPIEAVRYCVNPNP